MSAFHRQPSKVWWDSDPYCNPYYRPPVHHRTQSSSPGSQDSGFSDTETSPLNANPKRINIAPPDIRVNNNNVTTIKVVQDHNLKLVASAVDVNANNLLENAKEKYTPTKSNLRQLFEDRYKNGGPGPGHAQSVSPIGVLNTPKRRPLDSAVCSEPVAASHRYNKRNTISKVNRNLFKSIQALDERHSSNQYARSTASTKDHLTHTNNNTSQANTKDNYTNSSITQIPEETQSLPNLESSDLNFNLTTETNLNLTAPPALPELQQLSRSDIDLCQAGGEDIIESVKEKIGASDCDSEVEEIFPEHTSTPKQGPSVMKKDRLRRKLRTDKLLLKYKDERVPPIATVNINDYSDASLKAWYTDLNTDCEPECTTALQGKSIAAVLADSVAKLAAEKTRHLREILNDAIVVYTELDQLTNGEQLIQPSCAALSTYLRSYLSKHPPPSPTTSADLHTHLLDLSTLKSTPTPSYLHQLTLDFTSVHNEVVTTQVRRYLRMELAQPQTELDVRAAVVGMTSVCLHYAEGCDRRGVGLVGAFVGAVEILVSLCEMCEGSSVRRAILRALATVCANGEAVGRFESSGGVDKAIVDVVTDDALPEVERVEAIALLTQITAPWIDPPVTLPSIYPHLRPLIRSLTIFLHANTSCKQNLLLCTAALANLTTLYVDCVKNIVAFRTVDTLLKCLQRDKTANSSSMEVYILEQVAIVVANVSATEEGRCYLTDGPTTTSALVCFLQTKPYRPSEGDDDNHRLDDDVAVIQRLQQKTIIALSRLCSNPTAAQHVVKMGGVKRLVMLCRDKGERYESDAVLVAALATLRKISETCGATIMTEQDAQELVEPRLLDSFLAYSAQNESLV